MSKISKKEFVEVSKKGAESLLGIGEILTEFNEYGIKRNWSPGSILQESEKILTYCLAIHAVHASIYLKENLTLEKYLQHLSEVVKHIAYEIYTDEIQKSENKSTH